MKEFNPFWQLWASRIIEAAERDLGSLSRGWKINLLLDQLPALQDSDEAAQLLDSIGETNKGLNS